MRNRVLATSILIAARRRLCRPTALKKIGLKLEPAKGSGEFLVIDQVERSSENCHTETPRLALTMDPSRDGSLGTWPCNGPLGECPRRGRAGPLYGSPTIQTMVPGVDSQKSVMNDNVLYHSLLGLASGGEAERTVSQKPLPVVPTSVRVARNSAPSRQD